MAPRFGMVIHNSYAASRADAYGRKPRRVAGAGENVNIPHDAPSSLAYWAAAAFVLGATVILPALIYARAIRFPH